MMARRSKPSLVTSRVNDEHFMDLALAEARKGLGRTAPNPAVGAVVVKAGKVIAVGHHARAGGPHAEIVALKRAGPRARGSTLYTTLEPCAHHGRTPPCTDAILAARVGRVVFASDDPNPLVNGKGWRLLRRSGVAVNRGVRRTTADQLNRAWFHYLAHGVPYITLKVAVTADGKLATGGGDSRWITSAAAREGVHRLRDQVDAVLVGAGTVLADDPQLTARLPGGRSPLRVVLDGWLRTPRKAKVFKPGHLLFVGVPPPADDPRHIERLPSHRGEVSILQVIRRLGKRGIVHLVVEGGGDILTKFLERDLWDELLLYVAPKLAGPNGRPWFSGRSVARMNDALVLGRFEVSSIGPDALLRVERHPPSSL
jgi:diaminohydroxyphosphoribosylaminopyrimidine deaminase/5-amino-6-(5-phosphoribosylamino)uracil reductase